MTHLFISVCRSHPFFLWAHLLLVFLLLLLLLLVLLGEFCSLALTSQSEASFFAVVMLRCQRCVPFSNSPRESTPCNQESLAVRDITSVASSPTLASGFARMRAALQLVGGGEGSVVVEI